MNFALINNLIKNNCFIRILSCYNSIEIADITLRYYLENNIPDNMFIFCHSKFHLSIKSISILFFILCERERKRERKGRDLLDCSASIIILAHLNHHVFKLFLERILLIILIFKNKLK